MALVSKSIRIEEKLIKDIEALHKKKEKYKDFSLSDFTREALEEKYENEKKEIQPQVVKK